jgi:galactokinase
MTKAALQKEFEDRYGKKADHIFFCPGRVNLIGEHIDYNGGLVMPCAITRGTWLLVSSNTDKRLRFQCINFPELADLHLQSSYSRSGKEWFNYPLGVINALLEDQHLIGGMDMLFYGNLPIGAGLSSSASIEVVTGFAFSQLYHLNIDRAGLAVLAKRAENEFVGVNSGIMDQFAVALGREGKAILLNCDTLDYEYLPFETADYVLVIINSNKKRALADSKYNERFAECGAALKILKKEISVNHLCDITPTEFDQLRHLLEGSVLEKRALHVIGEQERVIKARECLLKGELKAFGQLMFESHDSLKRLYEVSGAELDAIVDFCLEYTGCIGARMTGAGFGGCAISLVQKDELRDFTEKLIASYTRTIGYEPEIVASGIGGGVTDATGIMPD